MDPVLLQSIALWALTIALAVQFWFAWDLRKRLQWQADIIEEQSRTYQIQKELINSRNYWKQLAEQHLDKRTREQIDKIVSEWDQNAGSWRQLDA